VTGYLVVGAVAVACTGVRSASKLRGRTGIAGWIGLICSLATFAMYVLWLFLAVAFGMMLGWTVPVWLCWVLALSTAWIVLAGVLPGMHTRLPLILPVGIWIAVCLSGWLREEAVIRCDDMLSLDPALELIVPTRRELGSCRPGESLPAGRYPRTIWQADDGDRIVFTTQGNPVPGGFDGSVCEAFLQSNARLRCVGPDVGKSHGLIAIPEIDRMIAIQYGLPTPSGPRGGLVMELPLSAELEVLEKHWFDDDVAQGFHEPSNHTLFLFTDSMRQVYRVSIPTFESMPALPVRGLCPSEMHYDVERAVGVACQGMTGAELRGEPFGVRYFADTPHSILDRIPSATWGCNWDPVAKKVFTTLPNLGLLVRIDFETGRIEKRWPIGFGMRSVEYDRNRRRVYVGDFLRGRVIAFDEQTERIVERWFVGRFTRWVRLTPDMKGLLVSSNLGVVRIPL